MASEESEPVGCSMNTVVSGMLDAAPCADDLLPAGPVAALLRCLLLAVPADDDFFCVWARGVGFRWLVDVAGAA